MTYADALQYLYEQLPMFSRIGAAAFNKDLSNTKQLCAVINNPQTKFKSITLPAPMEKVQ
jgi:dihydrofolate synthase/folylpolyglutamate synthase